MDDRGDLSAAGAHFYEHTAQRVPDASFDCKQEPTRRGNRVQIRLLNGKTEAVRVWDGVKRAERFTKLGRSFHSESQDRFVVAFPVHQTLICTNGSVWEVSIVLKSTATALGEIR